EIVLGKTTTTSTDIFSLGIVFYEILANRHPFRGDDVMSTMGRIVAETPPALHSVNPAVSPSIARIVAEMLEKNPANRYPGAAELLTDLNAGPAAAPQKKYSTLL